MKWFTVFKLRDSGLKFCYENEENPIMTEFVRWCDRKHLLDNWDSWGTISENDLKKRPDVIYVPYPLEVE